LTIDIENFKPEDVCAIDDVLRRSYDANHSFRSEIERYLLLQSECSFVARENSRVVGFGASIDYGAFSYIGLIGTDPNFQNRGIGHLIVDRILKRLDERKCPAALLDARPAAAPLYEQYGFVEEDSTDVFTRKKSPLTKTEHSQNIASLSREEVPELESFDHPIFGARRNELILSLWNDDPKRFLVSRDLTGRIDGYIVAQSRRIGPWVAASENVAECLLTRALGFSFENEEPAVFVSGANLNAHALLDRFGFEFQRSLQHMCRGTKVKRDRRTKLYGQASLGFG
jgi:GNAT superfamily N-acetyltransferase